jgi:Arc/MetJ-type ribon-helix-helix transcriptional regulator
MAMNTLSISLPAALQEFIDGQVAEKGYQTPSDYICALVTEAQRWQLREKVDQLLLEGLATEASEMTRADWESLQRRVWERHAGQGKP